MPENEGQSLTLPCTPLPPSYISYAEHIIDTQITADIERKKKKAQENKERGRKMEHWRKKKDVKGKNYKC